ncbi:sigma-70 family RNA polymerase sigma factor [Wolbachia endosymbiont (group A) of Apotomis capreana]|uniref:sigma-70 family RNA polymerase sigma factor n=1 Tax=Wolbachia endosymbiont (group A) of Apotomis capreana TaxID=3066165 RepID=UPI003132E7F0
MKSKNIYKGINPTIIKYVKYHALKLKSKSCFADESLEDIEQELICQIWPYLSHYDETRSSFNTFIDRLVNSRARNLLHKHQCMKYSMVFGLDDNIPDYKHFEDEVSLYFDMADIISTLPENWKNLCILLNDFTVAEVAEITGIPLSSVYYILKQMRNKFLLVK